MSNELTNSIVEAIRKRTSSVALGTYFFFWLCYHWEGVYVTLFTNEKEVINKFNMLKNEYVKTYFFGFSWERIADFALGILMPVFFTYAFIWLLPYVLLKAYEKEQEFKYNKRVIKLKYDNRAEKEKEKLVKQATKTIQAEVDKAKVEKTAKEIDPKIQWQKEFDDLDEREREWLNHILLCIYQGRGYIGGYNSVLQLGADALRFADSNDIVEIGDDSRRIKLTEKGKFFASRYNEGL